jgi:hypothetical protein
LYLVTPLVWCQMLFIISMNSLHFNPFASVGTYMRYWDTVLFHQECINTQQGVFTHLSVSVSCNCSRFSTTAFYDIHVILTSDGDIVKSMFFIMFNFSDPKSAISVINYLHLRFPSVRCSNPLLRKQTLNGDFSVFLTSIKIKLVRGFALCWKKYMLILIT